MSETNSFFEQLKNVREIETLCIGCQGTGIKLYSSTATWRGGIGGMMMTTDICDRCWGSGDANRTWVNLRELDAVKKENKMLREKVRTLLEWGAPYQDEQGGCNYCGGGNHQPSLDEHTNECPWLQLYKAYHGT